MVINMKNKRTVSLILSCVLLLSTLSVMTLVGFADDTDANGSYKYTSSTGTLEIFSDDIMIDRTEDDVVKNPWYSYKAAIEHIIIYDGVTKISDFAFCRQDNLVDIVIPDSVTSIGTAALAGCDSLKEITISDNVVQIGDNAIGFDTQMKVTDGFRCSCSAGSYAQNWCLKNYIPFNTPFSSSGSETAAIAQTGGKQAFWSFVPVTDCEISFYSRSSFDTVCLFYEYDTYTYSDTYSVMRGSAIYYNDDVGNNLNFGITAKLEAGKRYYLATRFKLSSQTGSYNVFVEATCESHEFKINCLEEDFITGDKQNLELECINCGTIVSMSFIDAMNENISCCDVNKDGYINAKDYAMILHNKY